MVLKGCQRCSGDMLVEEDIGSHVEELVCLQCGHRTAVAPNAEEYTKSTLWFMSQRPLRVAA
jgi:DNA-directed RNA polymerase subunit M/transcription elongation factor TFIIS